VQFRTQEFDNALKLYAKDSKRTNARICNATAFDVTLQAMRYIKRADKYKIDNLKDESNWPMWPKYIASRIKKGRSSFRVKANKKFGVGYSRLVKIQPGYTRSQAKALSTQIIAARKRATSFLAACWLPAFQHFAKVVFGSESRRRPPGGIKQHGKKKGYGIKAKEDYNVYSLISHMGLSARKFSSNPNPDPVVMRSLQMAINWKTVDFRKEIEKRYIKLGKKYSARR